MSQKCQVDAVLPFRDIPILSICCTLQGLNTQIHPHRNPNFTHVHKQHSDTLWIVFRCLEEVSESIKVKCMYVCWVWMRQMVYMSVQALYGAANARYANISETQNCVQLTLLRHQNTKTSPYRLSKNHLVMPSFAIFLSIIEKLLVTVFREHPVLTEIHN